MIDQKTNMWKNRLVKNIIKLFSILTVVVLTLGTTKVLAVGSCNWEDTAFKDMDLRAKGQLSLVETVTASGISSVIRLVPYIALGNTINTTQKCAYLLTNVSGDGTCTVDRKECAFIDGGYGPVKPDGSGLNYQNNGSLLGFSNLIEKAGREPLPLNLAFYFNKQAEKIPFVGSALAAAAPTNYGGPLLEYVWAVWQVARNFALGFMAIVILVVGIMIITRKSISAQAAVTVQMAIPRIIIAIILIVFSYPIGAVGASLAYNLRGSSNTIVQQIIAGFPATVVVQATGDAIAGVAIVGLFSALLLAAGVGPAMAIVFIGAILVVIVLRILLWIKMFGVYLKIMMSIVTAPFTFAIGSIPGNDDTTSKWFKQLASSALAIPAMALIADVGWGLTLPLVAEALTSGGFNIGALGTLGGGIMAVLMLPMISIFSLNYARTVPEKMDAMIVGEPKKKR